MIRLFWFSIIHVAKLFNTSQTGKQLGMYGIYFFIPVCFRFSFQKKVWFGSEWVWFGLVW